VHTPGRQSLTPFQTPTPPQDVRVCRAVQQPGEFVVTLPRAYHGGFSCGFCAGEAVNFATAEWLPYAQQCAARLRRLGLDHILPSEQLIVAEAESCLPPFLQPAAGAAAAVAAGAAQRAQENGAAAEGVSAGDSPEQSTASATHAVAAAATHPAAVAVMGSSENGGAANGSSSGNNNSSSAPPPSLLASSAIVLRSFVRLLHYHNTLRSDLLGRGVVVSWLGDDESFRSLPCVECHEPAFLAVVMRRSSGECFCVRCAAAHGSEGAGGAVLYVRRCMQTLEEKARWVGVCWGGGDEGSRRALLFSGLPIAAGHRPLVHPHLRLNLNAPAGASSLWCVARSTLTAATHWVSRV